MISTCTETKNNVSIADAAKAMNKSQQYIRIRTTKRNTNIWNSTNNATGRQNMTTTSPLSYFSNI